MKDRRRKDGMTHEMRTDDLSILQPYRKSIYNGTVWLPVKYTRTPVRAQLRCAGLVETLHIHRQHDDHVTACFLVCRALLIL